MRKSTDTLFVWFRVFILCAWLSACGGGDDSSSQTPSSPNQPPQALIAQASPVSAGTAVVLDGSASQDPEGNNLTYQWSISSSPAGSQPTLTNADQARPTLTTDRAGTYQVSLVVSDGGQTSPITSITLTVTAADLPTISLGQSEPLSGSVNLSLSGTVAGAVTWYQDLQLLGSASQTSSGALTWNTTGVPNGTHLLLARIQTGTNTFQEVRRSVEVRNSAVTLSASVSGVTGTINVDARATSVNGLSQLSATLDGQPLGTLNQPNACSRFCSGTNDVWRFPINAASTGSGAHTVVLNAVDLAGDSKSLTVSVPISNAPSLNLVTPVDGAFVHGTLQLSGTVSSDKPGAVAVSATLGSVSVPVTQAASFTGSFDLTSVPGGSYTLTVIARDADGITSQQQRQVVVTGTAGQSYTPNWVLPNGASLLAAEGNRVLMKASDGGVLSRNISTGTEVVLQDAAGVQYANDWQLSSGSAYAYGKAADCVLYCVYRWDGSGQRSNLTNPNPYSQTSNVGGGWAYDLHPVVKDGYALWINQGAKPERFTLLEIGTGSYRKIDIPAGANYLGNWQYDLAVRAGVVHVFYWAQTGGTGTSSAFDVYQWRSDTGSSTQLSTTGQRSIYVQTDGERVAWQQSAAGGSVDGSFSLMARPIDSGPAAQLSSTTTQFMLKDGVLAWSESASGNLALKVATSAATSTLSTQSTARMLAVGNGRVAFAQQGKLYLWDSTTGQTQQRVEVVPDQTFLTGGYLLFRIGTAVYRVQP